MSYSAFRCVSDGQSLEDTPWDTAKDLANQKDLDVWGCEEDGDESNDEDQADHDRLSISEAFADPTIEK